MRVRCLALAPLAAASIPPVFAQPSPPATTPAGIPLEAPWKESVFKFATEKLQHSA